VSVGWLVTMVGEWVRIFWQYAPNISLSIFCFALSHFGRTSAPPPILPSAYATVLRIVKNKVKDFQEEKQSNSNLLEQR